MRYNTPSPLRERGGACPELVSGGEGEIGSKIPCPLRHGVSFSDRVMRRFQRNSFS
jgi:hypothetical protein